jgi:predicted nucleotidyltransferase
MGRSLEAAARDRAVKARERLPAVVDLLVRRYGVTRVWLFGSLLGDVLEESSDVDLAVEGLEPARYWDASWRCDDAMGRHVDLVPIEDAQPTIRELVAREGVVLHG